MRYASRLVLTEAAVRVSVSWLTAIAVTSTMVVAGCATPEELQAAAARRNGEKQTGTNIAKKDHGNTRVTGVSGKDNIDDTMRDAIKLPDRAIMNPGGGG